MRRTGLLESDSFHGRLRIGDSDQARDLSESAQFLQYPHLNTL